MTANPNGGPGNAPAKQKLNSTTSYVLGAEIAVRVRAPSATEAAERFKNALARAFLACGCEEEMVMIDDRADRREEIAEEVFNAMVLRTEAKHE